MRDKRVLTPMMQQWHALKKEAKESLLLFRLGDFYEAFYEDAKIIAEAIELTLTKRQEIPMCGVPYHASASYIDKLLAKGYKIAVAEQVEQPGISKGIVKRKIVRVLSPGSLTDSSLLTDKEANYTASLTRIQESFGLSFIDVSTSVCKVMEVERKEDLFEEIMKYAPKEILLSEKCYKEFSSELKGIEIRLSPLLTIKPSNYFDARLAQMEIQQQFSISHMDGYGLYTPVTIAALGSLLFYLKEEMKCDLKHLKSIDKVSLSNYLSLDTATITNLELFRSSHQGKKGSLFFLLDKTETPMGARLLNESIRYPLRSMEKIRQRQDGVEELLASPHLHMELRRSLGKIKDIDRLLSRSTSASGLARDLVSLRFSLAEIPLIKQLLASVKSSIFQEAIDKLEELPSLTSLLSEALVDDPSGKLGEGITFQPNYSKELDELISIQRDGKSWIANYQEKLKEEHGIKSLKVGYTKAFGYYIEVSKGQSSKMPSHFHRRQTLVNAERFLSDELSDFEKKVLHAEERRKKLELSLFSDLQTKVSLFSSQIHINSQIIALIDFISSLARSALEYNFSRPLVDDSRMLSIKDGRHPVIEHLQEELFTPNDTYLDSSSTLYLITGPNKAGKSTFIRQTALIALLAHIGSFVPAREAHIGILDKIFSRIGASDDLSRGQSTFMVEMTETANILRGATEQSLVILDEIGRGTSTFDGIAIAWAVAEELVSKIEAKTLFATHYFELTDLCTSYTGAKNYRVAVEESDDGILFLHKIEEGVADKSYGIHVAKLAGLPPSVTRRAEKMLEEMEKRPTEKIKKPSKNKEQLSLFPKESPLATAIKSCNLDTMTPIEALLFLADLKKKQS